MSPYQGEPSRYQGGALLRRLACASFAVSACLYATVGLPPDAAARGGAAAIYGAGLPAEGPGDHLRPTALFDTARSEGLKFVRRRSWA